VNRVLLRYELLGLVRDTRTIVLSVLLPIILLPILLFTVHRFGQRLGASSQAFNYGRAEASAGLEAVTSQAFAKIPFQETPVENSEKLLADGSLDVVLKVGQPEKSDRELMEDIGRAFPGTLGLMDGEKPGRPVLELLYRGDRDRSVRAYINASEKLSDFRDSLLKAYFSKRKAQVGVELQVRDISSVQEREARRYGPALASFMILILLGGGSVAALDSLAGERERGTLTTLFLSSLPRAEIIWTKFAAVALISVAVAGIQAANLGVYLALGWMKLPALASPAQAWTMAICLGFLFLAQSMFTAALLLHISARSGSFKEAQLFFFPAFLVAFALSLSGLMPGLPSRSLVSLIPLAGPGVLVPEILASRVDFPILLLQMVVHLVAARLLLGATLSYVRREEFLGGQAPAVGSALLFEQFSARALPFYAFLGAALMVVPANFAGLSTLVGQGLFNQLILFGLGPLLLLRLFSQKVGVAVPLRPVSLPILLASLALIPLGQIAATGLSHLLGPLLPPPVKALEQMMAFLDLGNTPAWQIVLLIGILPGICEEFAFRGVLMHALHRRFGPWTLAAVVAVIFGLFHLTFYRVVPTAYLGFFLGLITLATGSLIPAMLVHIGNNSLAVFALLNGWDFEGLGTVTYLTGFVGQLVVTALILRWGRGYPGTSWRKPD
jgi:membrane protease YdiL (CAAX protease family)/ABC-type Na+ efflux pump permease subunit